MMIGWQRKEMTVPTCNINLTKPRFPCPTRSRTVYLDFANGPIPHDLWIRIGLTFVVEAKIC